MGNNQSQRKNHTNFKTKTKEQFKKLFLIKKDCLFSKLSQKLHHLLHASQIFKSQKIYFSQTSGCFQIVCQRLLNVKCEIIQSQNWKLILQSILCIPIRSLPYGEAIKSVRYETKQFPVFIEHKINYSGFQKAIPYYEYKFGEKQLIKNSDYITALQFATNNTDILLRVRQGFEIHTQLPELLMLNYNLHDYVKIYCKYLEIRFSKCNLEQFIQIWHHYQGWISSVENQTSNLIFLFNQIIDESLPQYKLPKYTVRHFMVCEWMIKANKAEIIENLEKNLVC